MSLFELVNEADALQLQYPVSSGVVKNMPKFRPVVSQQTAKRNDIQIRQKQQKMIEKINKKYSKSKKIQQNINKNSEEEDNMSQNDPEVNEVNFYYETFTRKTGVNEYSPDANKQKFTTWKFGDNYEEEDCEEDVQTREIDYPGADDFDPDDLDTY